MHTRDIIAKKRNGEPLTYEEIEHLVGGYCRGSIPDYQMSAFLMAVCFQGMNSSETTWLTIEMMRSGKVLDLSSIPGKKIDKHSTGGVGDKVSLVLAPLVASLGVKVPMISGRGLGHTGGTLDKLESIPGFRTNLTTKEFIANVRDIGVAIIGQSLEIVPADGRMYSLRDVTATIDSIPLIASSIMSKKMAAGLDGLVLDIKTGNGAFMSEYEQALELAKTMVQIGEGMQKDVAVLVTDMNQPLGRMVGNAMEVLEAVQTLQGEGPADLVEVTLALGATMLRLADIAADFAEAKDKLSGALQDGRALKKFEEMVDRQGGDLDRLQEESIAEKTRDLLAPASGYVSHIDTRSMGTAATVLGAGRQEVGDDIDHSVGYEVLAKIGDWVETGDPLVRIFYDRVDLCNQAEKIILDSYALSDDYPKVPPLFHSVVTGEDIAEPEADIADTE